MRIKYNSLLLVMLFCVSAFLFISPVAAQTRAFNFKPFKFLFLPDIHLSFEKNDDWIMHNESLVILQDVVKTVSQKNDLNFVIFGGDLTENKDKQLTDLPVFLDTIDSLNYPYYVILGDRDSDLVADYTKQYFCSEFRRNGFKDIDKTYWAVEPTENVLLIGLDTTISNSSKGELSAEQLLWLQSVLSDNPDKFTIISMHHPAYLANTPPNPDFLDNNIISNSKLFMNLISVYPQVKLVVSGHTHTYSVSKFNNIIFMNLPSIVTYPNQYKVISVFPNKIEIGSNEINYKQLIKKSKKAFASSSVASSYGFKKHKELFNYQSGKEYNQVKQIYFNTQN